MKIAFCTTCKNRTQHLEKTLPQNLADNADYPEAKFIILDYDSRDHLLDFLRTKHAEEIEAGRVVCYSYRETVPFQVAHAKNMAHRLGMLEGADVLVNLDADNFTGSGFASWIAEQFAADENIFLFARMIQEGPDRLPRGINGRIAASTKAFLKVGGYDERFAVWSPDDKDYNLRLRRLGYRAQEIDRRFLNCIRHNDKMRFKHISTHEGYGDEKAETVDSCDTTVVNYGKIGCGSVFRLAATDASKIDAVGERGEIIIEDDAGVRTLADQQGVFFGDQRPSTREGEIAGIKYPQRLQPSKLSTEANSQQKIELRPLPTRIFGIGMHKTATTSLHRALKILGYDSAHWKDAHWAKAIWEEMTSWGRSSTLEKHYALSDLPIPLLYQPLDVAYPGSKFVLTIRNEENWLQSVRNHWSHDSNKFRGAWSTDPFSHKVHKLLYGQKGFDAEIFLARYRRHNAEVLEYFKDRPQDLLVMDMDKNPGWFDLCQFLGHPVPSVSYPRALVTRKPLVDAAEAGSESGKAL